MCRGVLGQKLFFFRELYMMSGFFFGVILLGALSSLSVMVFLIKREGGEFYHLDDYFLKEEIKEGDMSSWAAFAMVGGALAGFLAALIIWIIASLI